MITFHPIERTKLIIQFWHKNDPWWIYEIMPCGRSKESMRKIKWGNRRKFYSSEEDIVDLFAYAYNWEREKIIKIPLPKIGKLREMAVEHYKRKVMVDLAILKYLGVDSNM